MQSLRPSWPSRSTLGIVVASLDGSERGRRVRSVLWAGPIALVAGVYLSTMAPGAYGLDSAELATGAFSLGIVHPTGYPLYLLIAKAFTLLPWGSIAWRVNLLSGVCGVLAVAGVWRLGARRSGSPSIALVGALSLAFSISFWRMATVAEVYTLNVVVLMGLLLLCERWLETRQAGFLLGMALVFGLGLANHVTSLFYAPILLAAVARIGGRRTALRLLPALAVMVAVGLATYLYFPLRAAANPPLNYVRDYYGVDVGTFKGIWWMASGTAYRFFAFGYDLMGYLNELRVFSGSLLRNMTAVGLALGIAGGAQILRRRDRLGVALAVVFLANVLFFSGYAVGDKETMFLPAYAIWAVWMVDGATWVLAEIQRRAVRLGAPPNLAAVGFGVVLGSMVALTLMMNWRWADLSHVDMPERQARLVLRSLPKNAFIAGPWSEAVVLEYVQIVEGLRPDVRIFNRSRFEVAEYYRYWSKGMTVSDVLRNVHAREAFVIRSATAEGPVYDLEYVASLARTFEYKPVGAMFQVEPFSGVDPLYPLEG